MSQTEEPRFSFAASGLFEGDYAVVVTLGDGVSNEESHWGLLTKALEEADRVRAELREKNYHDFHVGVIDRDDPGRGWLSEDDAREWEPE